MTQGVSSARRVQDGLGLSPVAVAAVTRAVNLLLPRLLARALIWLLLGARPLFTAARLQAWWREHLTCERPDRAAASQGAFLNRFMEQMLGSGSFATFAGHVARADRWRLAGQLEALSRVALLGWARHFMLESRDGPPPLSEVWLASCARCDQSCAGCYSVSERVGEEPARKRLSRLIDQAAWSGAAAVHVIGKGEPFLDERHGLDLIELARARPHLFFTVATGGAHLTEALARALARTPNAMCLVSVDGLAATHDARRGAGSFQKVCAAMRLLRERGAAFACSSTVTAENWAEVSSLEFVAQMRRAGCAMGVYSRFFALPPALHPSLRLAGDSRESFREALARAQVGAGMPLLDLDDLEERGGCRARAGLSVYVDGTTGLVAPCIRVPWAPASCRLAHGRAGGLDEVLRHPFFEEYRRGECAKGSWCGSDLDAEQAAVAARARSFAQQ